MIHPLGIINNKEAISVCLPEGAILMPAIHDNLHSIVEDVTLKFLSYLEPLPGSWSILIPDCSKATEEEAASICEVIGHEPYIGYGGTYLYKNYLKDEGCWTALESLSTLLEREKLYSVNPMTHPADIDPASRAHYDKLKSDWQAAQSRVGVWCILVKN
jgi:hypothetical protein